MLCQFHPANDHDGIAEPCAGDAKTNVRIHRSHATAAYELQQRAALIEVETAIAAFYKLSCLLACCDRETTRETAMAVHL